MELHQYFIFSDFRNRSFLVHKTVEVVLLVLNNPLLHSGRRHVAIENEYKTVHKIITGLRGVYIDVPDVCMPVLSDRSTQWMTEGLLTKLNKTDYLDR
jgi:hypothetical protein